VNKLITLLVIMANICAGALLAFHLAGWMSVSAEQVREAMGFSTAGAAAVILITGISNDIFQGNRRPFGIAIFLCSVWVAAGPVMELKPLSAQFKGFFRSLIASPSLILCLYMLILSRLCVFGQKQPLGYGLALLVTALLSLQALLLEGPVYDNVFYFGVVSMMVAFTVTLGLGAGYQNVASWGLVILLSLGGAYHMLT